MASEPFYDPQHVGASLLTAMRERRLSCRQAAALVGVSPATLNRVTRGHASDVETYLRVQAFLSEPPHAD